jgi:hypothetical protein
MQYMIIEKYHAGKVKEVYQRFAEKGRMLPAGVQYINSWINEDVTICYQLMEADKIEQLQQWINNWNALVDFEIIPVISSVGAKEKIMSSD